jgi:hypothetical protein
MRCSTLRRLSPLAVRVGLSGLLVGVLVTNSASAQPGDRTGANPPPRPPYAAPQPEVAPQPDIGWGYIPENGGSLVNGINRNRGVNPLNDNSVYSIPFWPYGAYSPCSYDEWGELHCNTDHYGRGPAYRTWPIYGNWY